MKILTGMACLLIFLLTSNAYSQEIDSRVYNHYSKEEVNTMGPEKIEKMNFLLRESFIIPDEMKDVISHDDVDVLDYAVLRLEDQRAKVHLLIDKEISDGPYFYLISFKELDAAYMRIDESFGK